MRAKSKILKELQILEMGGDTSATSLCKYQSLKNELKEKEAELEQKEIDADNRMLGIKIGKNFIGQYYAK